MRLVIIYDNFGPYHLARLRAARHYGQKIGIEILGFEIVEISSDYAWITSNNEIRKNIFTLFSSNNDISRKPSTYNQFIRVWQALSQLAPDAVAIPGYQGVVSLAAFLWGKTKKKSLIMMSESTRDDKDRNPYLEWCKSQLVRRYDAALVGGKRQQEYAAFLGIPLDRIFLGCDVIDNDHFARGADEARRKEEICRRRYRLPEKYFLVVSRFIGKKNLPFLIDAYREYRRLAGEQAWDLVLCGSGPLAPHLKDRARDLPGTHFPGFKQADELPLYYGLAKTFILPSSHFEQWGLVVNEAMASGLPVLVSRVCGCAPDLVCEGENGFTFDPFDLEALARLMAKMTLGEVNLIAMSEASRKIIAAWTPETFAKNLIQAVKSSSS